LSKGWKLTKLPDLDEGMRAMMEAACKEEEKPHKLGESREDHERS